MTNTAMPSAVVFRDAEYGALAVEPQRGGLLIVNHGLIEASVIDRVLENYATSEPRDEGVTFWRARYGVHPAGVLATIKQEMRLQGYESDRLAERAIYSMPADDARKPDLPAGGRAPLVREAVDRGVRQQIALVIASLRESGATASAPTVKYHRRPNAQMSYGRQPPFAVSRFFVGSAKGSTALREAVLGALAPWHDYVVKASVAYMAEGQYAIEVGIALPHSVCEAFVDESVPTFPDAELAGARSIVFRLGSPLTEEERRDIEEMGRACTGCVSLKVEGDEVTAQVPGNFVGNFAADRAMNERLSWLAGVLEPWNPTVLDIGGLEEVNLTPEPTTTPLRELGESCSHGQDLAAYRQSVVEAQGVRAKDIQVGDVLKVPPYAGWSTVVGVEHTSRAVKLELELQNGLVSTSLAPDRVVQIRMNESINEEEDGGYEVADHGLPPEVNTILTQFVNVKQHLWDTPQMQGAVKKAKKLVKDKHGKEVADEFATKLDIARATACESVNEALPSHNIYWRDLQGRDVPPKVTRQGNAYIAFDPEYHTVGVVNWNGQEAREAQRWLDSVAETVEGDMMEGEGDTPWDKAQLGRTLVKAAGNFKPSHSATLDGSDDSEEGTDRPANDSKPKNADDGDGDDTPDKAKGDEEEKDGDEDGGKVEEAYSSKRYVNGSWPKDKAMLVRKGMPKEVQKVADEAHKSAVEGTKDAQADMQRMYGPGGKYEDPSMLDRDIDYTGDVSITWYGEQDGPQQMGPPNTWSVTNALEDSRTVMRFYVDDGKWYYDGYYGKKPMPGELMFHG